MKIIKLLGMTVMFVIAWHFMKSHKNSKPHQRPGALTRLVRGIKDEIQKPLNKIDDDIAVPGDKV